MTSTGSDDFIEKYEALGLEVAGRYGYAVPTPPGARLSSSRREHLAKNRSARALKAISELQQWLLDDDAEVRRTARDGIRKALYVAYTGDNSGPELPHSRLLQLPDRLLMRVLRRDIDPDAPEPTWSRPKSAMRIRRAAITAALVSACCTGLALATGHFVLALVLLPLTMALDVLEGSFARLSRVKDAHLRWLSCVSSHAGDLVMLGGVALSSRAYGSSDLVPLVVGVTLVAMFVSFIRVSALQAGYRFWRSLAERLTRWGSIAAYAAAVLLGYPEVGVLVLITALGCFAVYEVTRVLHGVDRMSPMHGGIVLINEGDATISSYRLEDGCDTWLPRDRHLSQFAPGGTGGGSQQVRSAGTRRPSGLTSSFGGRRK